jgi:SOS-response transcriptional repressor LexA
MIESTLMDAEIELDSTENNFANRVLMILKQQKRTKSWLAEEIGVTKQGMNYILSRSSKKLIKQIALALEINSLWLESGEGNYYINSSKREDVIYLPLMNMQYMFDKGVAKTNNENIIVSNTNLSINCFATVLDNTSMEPLFRQGSILIFDPEKQLKSGDYVLFSLTNTNETFFRQYFREGKNYYFKSIDTMYKIITSEEIVIHGVLVESRNCFS